MMNVTSIIVDDQFKCKFLFRFSNMYRPIHGYLSTVVCLIGIPSNILNIIVLTRPNLISSPTNVILTGLAFSDLLTMCSYLPFAIYNNILYPEPHYCSFNVKPNVNSLVAKNNFIWTNYLNFHVNFSITVHSISIWLTVYLAIFRFIFIATSTQVNLTQKSSWNRLISYLRTYKSTMVMMSLIILFCILFCSPSYALFKIVELPLNELVSNSVDYTNMTIYGQKERFNNTNDQDLLFKITLFTQAVCGKLIPCVILTTFTSLLIKSLITINSNKKKLLTIFSKRNKASDNDVDEQFIQTDTTKSRFSPTNTRESRLSKTNNENLRTTLILVIVCSLFLITELPQSVLILLSLDLTNKDESNFYNSVYMPLGDLVDMIALFNNSINFVLYCTMSRAFRETFYSLFAIDRLFKSKKTRVNDGDDNQMIQSLTPH
jgi:hypothetical protein